MQDRGSRSRIRFTSPVRDLVMHKEMVVIRLCNRESCFEELGAGIWNGHIWLSRPVIPEGTKRDPWTSVLLATRTRMYYGKPADELRPVFLLSYRARH